MKCATRRLKRSAQGCTTFCAPCPPTVNSCLKAVHPLAQSCPCVGKRLRERPLTSSACCFADRLGSTAKCASFSARSTMVLVYGRLVSGFTHLPDATERSKHYDCTVPCCMCWRGQRLWDRASLFIEYRPDNVAGVDHMKCHAS